MLKSQMIKSYNQSQNDRETVDFVCQINYTIQKTRKQAKKQQKYIIIDDKFLGIANAPCFMVKYK
jgi:hypothetical protein